MKKLLISVAVFAFAIASFAQAPGYEFTTVVSHKATPVKDQSSTGTCWCFATASFMESELLRMGKGEYDLSEMFIVRQKYMNQMEDNYLRRGKGNIGEGSLAHTFKNAYKQVGIVPEEAYSGLIDGNKEHNHGALSRYFKALVDANIASKKRTPQYYQGHNNTIINGIPRIGWMTGGKSALWKDEDIADIITHKAKKFITSHKEEPFFLYMGTQDVHVPRIPHPRFAGKSGLGTRGDVILQLDWTIGEIMNTLDSLNIADNTILVFTSDNGPVIDDGYQDHAYELLNGHTPMGIYRGGKYSAYEAGTRIPFIVRWPAKVKPSKQQSLFSQIDVYASLASLLNQPLRKGAAPDSQEHLNTFLGRNNTGREYIVQQNLNNTLAIVKGQWKYIEPSDAPAIEFWTKMELGNDQQPQLYDLSSDPSEKTNVAKQHPDIVKELAELLESVKEK